MISQYEKIRAEEWNDLCKKVNLVQGAVQEKMLGDWGYINLKVEGGGIIFFDWKYGFTGATTTGTNGCSVSADTTSDLGNYYIENGVVKCNRVGSKHRFYVVAESDLTDSTVGWDTVTYSTSRATSTGFGTGKANTTLLCNAITNDMWPLVKTARATNPSGHDLVSDDSDLDTRWFVPSKDELYVLTAMQYTDSAYRPSGIPQLSINYSAGTLNAYYWSSSQSSDTVYSAWVGDVDRRGMYNGYKNFTSDTLGVRVRLCRTF